jgi:hypothetical protein
VFLTNKPKSNGFTFTAPTNLIIKSTTTNTEGTFNFDAINSGSFYIIISGITIKDFKSQNFDVTNRLFYHHLN